MKSKQIYLSVIIPVFNEEKTVLKIINKVLKYIPSHSEVIIIDDGSADQTSEILKKFNRNKKVRIKTLSENRGKGFAIRTGMAMANGKVLLIQDADLEYDPQDYQKLLKPIKDGLTQVVYGSRLANHPLNLRNLRSMPLPLNFLANKLLSFFTNLLYGSNLTDMETCYKVFTRKVLESFKLVKDGFDIEAEITTKILLSGFKIVEVPIETIPRTYREGKKITWIDGIHAVFTLLEYRINRYWIAVFLTILTAVFFRFYNFSDRYGLWSDQARDALVGRVSITNNTLPLIGSFSSAGPFTFGPFWYWQSAVASVLFKSHMGYWFLTNIFSILMVIVMIWIGKAIGGRFMSILLGLLAATSFTQIQSSLGSTQHSMVGVTSTFFLAAILYYLKSRSAAALFFTGFFLSSSMNYHYQAFYLIPMFVILLLVKRPSVKALVFGFLGLALPFIPLLVFDLQHNWWNLTKMLDYYRFGQYRIYVPNRWLTYAGIFWPSFWAKTAGGSKLFAYVTMLGVGLIFSLQLLRGKLRRSLLVYGLGFLSAIVWFRYFRGERYDGYVVYAQPLVLVFTAWFVSEIYKRRRVFALLLSIILIAGSINTIYKDFGYKNPYRQLNSMKNVLVNKYPHSTFALYDKDFRTSGCSISLSLILDDYKLSTDDGIKVGVCDKDYCPPQYPSITTEKVGEFDCRLVNFEKAFDEGLVEENWILVSPNEVNRMTVEWWKE